MQCVPQRNYDSVNHQLPDRTTFTKICWSFLYSIEVPADSFSCPVCGDFNEAPILVLDGTTLAFQRKHARADVPLPTTGQKRRGIELQQRIAINDRTVASLLTRFANQASPASGNNASLKQQVRTWLPPMCWCSSRV